MSQEKKTMSGAEFKLYFAELVAGLKDDDEVYFGAADLSFNRIKNRGPEKGPAVYFVEFNEVYQIIQGD